MIRRESRRIWVRAAIYGVAGVVAALASVVLAPYLDAGRAQWLGANAVKDLLTILASSMLAVATFSLSTMVSAFASAASSATPRASKLLIEDSTAQQALATFIGAFLFSIVGLIALSTGLYGAQGRVLMFGVTVVVIGIVVARLIRWIHQLADFGRVAQIIGRVERATFAAIDDAARVWGFSERPVASSASTISPGAVTLELVADTTGYLAHVDLGRLQALADQHHLRLSVERITGGFVYPRSILATVHGNADGSIQEELRAAFTIGPNRTFEQDPRFGFIVLSEIASRALSPAVNDPGTAIQVLNTQARLMQRVLAIRAEGADRHPRCSYDRLSLPTVVLEDLLVDAYRPIARDGAGLIEVDLRLLRTLEALVQDTDAGFARVAKRFARQTLPQLESGLQAKPDRDLLLATFAATALAGGD